MKNLIITSDLHLSEAWDHINRVIPKEHNILNPNESFRNLTESLTPNETLILNGDLVDYELADYQGKSKRSNWDILFNTLKNTNVKYLLNLGNHDFKKLALNHRILNLMRINLKEKIRKQHAKLIAHSDFRFLTEFKSFLSFTNPIKKYFLKDHYSEANETQKLIFCNTGRDAFLKPSNFLKPYRAFLLLENLLTNIENSVTHGLTGRQIKFVKKELFQGEEKETFIFLHCPPFFSYKKIENAILRTENEFVYFRNLRKQNLCDGFFLFNNRRFMNAITKSQKNITVITSHIHDEKSYLLEKRNLLLNECTIEKVNEERMNPAYIKFISTLPLGHLGKINKKIGYLNVTPKEITHHIIKEVIQ